MPLAIFLFTFVGHQNETCNVYQHTLNIEIEEPHNHEPKISNLFQLRKERRWSLSADSADMKLSSSGCNFSQRAAGGPDTSVRPCGILICIVLVLDTGLIINRKQH